MSEFVQDLRVGARQLVRRPGFALTAIGSLALGIGVTTTLFTVVNAVLFKSSPLRDRHAWSRSTRGSRVSRCNSPRPIPTTSH